MISRQVGGLFDPAMFFGDGGESWDKGDAYRFEDFNFAKCLRCIAKADELHLPLMRLIVNTFESCEDHFCRFVERTVREQGDVDRWLTQDCL